MTNEYKHIKLGKNNIIEIDESVFARTNNHKSGYDVNKKNAKIWVLGFYERKTNLARAFVVPNRSMETLTNIIRENVHDGAIIYTDFWKGYNGLKIHFDHRPINKSVKDPGKYSE
jgi:transposase-like protein